jgi:hypothetical protein
MKTTQCKTLYHPATEQFASIQGKDIVTHDIPMQCFPITSYLEGIKQFIEVNDNWNGIELITIKIEIV